MRSKETIDSGTALQEQTNSVKSRNRETAKSIDCPETQHSTHQVSHATYIPKRFTQLTSISPPLTHARSMRLIPSRRLANSLVPRREQYNRKQRDDERERARDAPATEYDAQVGRVPCEQHLQAYVLALRWEI